MWVRTPLQAYPVAVKKEKKNISISANTIEYTERRVIPFVWKSTSMQIN